MRTASYRDDVLWAIAHKLGLNPPEEFLTDEGESLASYINAWVRRTWDSADFPEWATIKEFTPDAKHQVLYRAFAVGEPAPVVISRPLKVYLVDPRLSPYPIDTHFREWDEGLHVGFDHGATVWIKYLGTAPKFTSVRWDSTRSYGNGELAYSPSSGECYKSLVAGNQGNDPVVGFPAALSTEIIQAALPPDPGHDGQTEIIDVYAEIYADPTTPSPPIILPPPVGTIWKLEVMDQAGTTILGTASHTQLGADTFTDIVNALAAALSAAPGMAGFTITPVGSERRIRLENLSDFKISTWVQQPPSSDVVRSNKRVQVRTFIAPIPPSSGLPQITRVTISQDQVKGCTTYTLTLRDPEGNVHTASYYAAAGEALSQILVGLAGAINGSGDTWFTAVSVSIDPVLGTILLSTMGGVSTDAQMNPESSAYWDRVLFPYALIEPVVRGAYSDALREAGQTDKGMAEEQGAVQEAGDRIQKAIAPAYDTLTDQQRPAPRYRTRAAAGGGK